MEYREFLSSVHERYSLYGAQVRFATCFHERLTEERPELVARLSQTGRKVVARNGQVKFSREAMEFIRDVWDR